MKQRLILMLALAASYVAAAAADFEADGIWYNLLSPTTVEVTQGDYGGDVVIPETVTYEDVTYTVTAIGEDAFHDSGVNTVTMPTTVTSIGVQAFMSSPLTEVTIPESVTTIGEGAFGNCGSLTAIKGKFATADNYALIDNGTLIAFVSDAMVFSYRIPETVTKIGNYAFYGNQRLKFVSIPTTVKEIGDNAFQNCENLISMTIPNSVKTIGNDAFHDCRNLVSVTMANSVTSIGGSAFRGCLHLKSVTLSNSLTTIKSGTFFDCYDLPSIIIPTSVTTIGEDAFRFCWSLTELTIPNSVKEIHRDAFAGCHKLQYVSLPNGLKRLEEETFSECYSLTEITIPESVTYIDRNVFYGCDKLIIKGKYVSADNSYMVINNVLYKVFPAAKLTTFTVPDNVTKIAECAFKGCKDLISLEIPSNVTEIDGWAFAECENLQSIILPENITEIKDETFWGCPSLKSVTLPENLRVIGFRAFGGCAFTSLDLPNKLERIDSQAFWECRALETLTLPQSLVELGDLVFYYRCPSLREVNGKFATADHHCLIDSEGALKFLTVHGLTEYTLPEGVKRIAPLAASMTNNSKLRTINLPHTVETIEWVAFQGTNLTTMTLPNSVTRINDAAFSGMVRLHSIVIPASVQVMQGHLFEGSNNLLSITIEASDPTAIQYEGDIFEGFDNYDGCTLYVPAGSKGLYSVHEYWGRIANIVEMESTDAYRFGAEEITLAPDELTLLPVSMVNANDIIGLQFDVMLPDGFTLAQNSRGRYYIEKSERMYDHNVSAQEFEGGVRFVVNSLTNTEFEGNDGVLFSLPVIATGDQRTDAIVIRNIIITDSGFNEIELPTISVAAKVRQPAAAETCVPGDVNGDGRFTITDVTAVVGYVLGTTPAGTNRQAADVNGDGEYTVTDITLVISSVLAQ